MKLNLNLKQFKEDFQLFLFNHPKVTFEDMKMFNQVFDYISKNFKRFKMNNDN